MILVIAITIMIVIDMEGKTGIGTVYHAPLVLHPHEAIGTSLVERTVMMSAREEIEAILKVEVGAEVGMLGDEIETACVIVDVIVTPARDTDLMRVQKIRMVEGEVSDIPILTATVVERAVLMNDEREDPNPNPVPDLILCLHPGLDLDLGRDLVPCPDHRDRDQNLHLGQCQDQGLAIGRVEIEVEIAIPVKDVHDHPVQIVAITDQGEAEGMEEGTTVTDHVRIGREGALREV